MQKLCQGASSRRGVSEFDVCLLSRRYGRFLSETMPKKGSWMPKPGNSLMSGLGTTVFEVMSALARKHESVNLGQGFPDDKGPEAVRVAAADYLMKGHNQ